MRNFVLYREDIIEIAIIALGPQVVAELCVDQLRCDPDAIASFAHAALDDVSDTKLPREMTDIDWLALESERRVACYHRERRDLREICDDVFGDGIAEVLLLRIAAHVGERQDS